MLAEEARAALEAPGRPPASRRTGGDADMALLGVRRGEADWNDGERPAQAIATMAVVG